MTILKRCAVYSGAVFVSVVLLLALALNARAASASSAVNVTFWKEKSDKESMANKGIDSEREAKLAYTANGTYTLELPIKQVSKMGVTGYLTGLTIGDVAYDGTVSGSVEDGTGVLTIKNLPSSVLTGSDISDALVVTCSIHMDADILGTISTTARMCVWAK